MEFGCKVLAGIVNVRAVPASAPGNPGLGEIRPRWYDLVTWENKPVGGGAQMLMSFELLTAAEIEAFGGGDHIPSIVPPTLPMTLELTTLGLRDLSRYELTEFHGVR